MEYWQTQQRQPSLSERFSSALGTGLQQGSQMMQQQQQNQALQQAGIPQNLPPEFQKLSYASQLKKKEEAEKLQGIEAKKKKEHEELQPKLNKFADELELSNPESPIHKTVANIYRSDLPLDQKSKLIKDMVGVDPFKQKQQHRLQMDSALNRYTKRIKELSDQVKNVRNPNSSGKMESERLNNQLSALRDERDKILNFQALTGDLDNEDKIGIEEEEPSKIKKVKFNPDNKEHQAKARQLFKDLKDKEKVRKMLEKEFTF